MACILAAAAPSKLRSIRACGSDRLPSTKLLYGSWRHRMVPPIWLCRWAFVCQEKSAPSPSCIDQIGFQIEARFTAGNLGPLDLHPGFKPPTGVGLAIDAEVVHGGGIPVVRCGEG